MGMERRAEPRTGFRGSWMYVIFSKQSVVDPSGREGWEITSDGKEEAKRKVMSNKGSAGQNDSVPTSKVY